MSKYPIDKTKTLKLLLAKLHEKMKHESRPHSVPTDYEEIVKEEIFRLANDNQELLWDKDDPTKTSSDNEDGKMFYREKPDKDDDDQKKKNRRERRFTKKMRRTRLFHFKVLELQQYEDLRSRKWDTIDEFGVLSAKTEEEMKEKKADPEVAKKDVQRN